MNILQGFQAFLKKQQLFAAEDKVLLAVSGGMDSVVMMHLFEQAGLSFGLAHCNFQLRGVESDKDEQFVKKLAASKKIPCFITSFATGEIAAARKESIQVVARELRYEWLEKIRREHHYHWIATAHHLNDAIETFLYNFSKGAGLRGLRGISPKNGKIIRPLLFAQREEIEAFATTQGISFREDRSNATDKYARNKIRHHVIPVLKTINPSLEETAVRNLNYLEEAFYLYQLALSIFKEKWVQQKGAEIQVLKEGLRQHSVAAKSLLFECIREYGFHSDQIDQMLDHLGGQAGALFFSPTHRVLADRKAYLLEPRRKIDDSQTTIGLSANQKSIELSDGILTFEKKAGQPKTFSSTSHSVYIDMANLRYPLQLRRWRPGDLFCPLGMGGKHQKLQDFFSNNAFSRFDKEKVWLLVNADDTVIWVVGHRLDERFKILPTTKSFLEIKYLKENL